MMTILKAGENMFKIMIVDDEPDLREMIRTLIKTEGFDTDTAENGKEFLKKIDVSKPDLVTLDVKMPGLTTQEILKELNEKQNKTKIILLTVVRFSEKEKENILTMANVVDYIIKPFEIDQFLDTVKKHII
jgi:DNA-binding response OmpR family regulator